MTTKIYNDVEVVASALIVNKEGKLLLMKSPKWGDRYLIPGGHIDKGETIFEAAKREGEEETGLKLKPLYCVNAGELINDPSFYRKAHLIYFHIVCEALIDTTQPDSREVSEVVWLSPQEALKLPNLRVKNTIENYMRGVKIQITSKAF